MESLREARDRAEAATASVRTALTEQRHKWGVMQKSVSVTLSQAFAHDIQPEDAGRAIAEACDVELAVERSLTATITLTLTVEVDPMDARAARVRDLEARWRAAESGAR